MRAAQVVMAEKLHHLLTMRRMALRFVSGDARARIALQHKVNQLLNRGPYGQNMHLSVS